MLNIVNFAFTSARLQEKSTLLGNVVPSLTWQALGLPVLELPDPGVHLPLLGFLHPFGGEDIMNRTTGYWATMQMCLQVFDGNLLQVAMGVSAALFAVFPVHPDLAVWPPPIRTLGSDSEQLSATPLLATLLNLLLDITTPQRPREGSIVGRYLRPNSVLFASPPRRSAVAGCLR